MQNPLSIQMAVAVAATIHGQYQPRPTVAAIIHGQYQPRPTVAATIHGQYQPRPTEAATIHGQYQPRPTVHYEPTSVHKTKKAISPKLPQMG